MSGRNYLRLEVSAVSNWRRFMSNSLCQESSSYIESNQQQNNQIMHTLHVHIRMNKQWFIIMVGFL